MIVGIDLGTTHSLIGRYSEDGPHLFPNALGEVLTPSVVSVDGDTILVGQPARDRLVSHPGDTVAAFKRWLGTARETQLGKRSFRPEELSALVLRSLVADAEAATGEKITEAVISVPAYFSDAQRKATRAAGELAGLKVERLINEPTAAALAYGLQRRETESRFLVFDLGGGTFDVSILELFEGVVEVHASAGDNFLGGEDFTLALLRAFGEETDALINADAQTRGRLVRALEHAKRALATRDTAEVDVQVGDQRVHWTIDADRFAAMCDPLVQRMRAPLERAMRDARLSPADLDEVLLVGGASRMPLVARMVSRMFGRLPLRHVDPDQAIALGAAVAAGMKARDASLEEIILTDVCPYTLGTAVTRVDERGTIREGYFHPIIQRNSTVPVSREDVFSPVEKGQRQLQIEIYQGENPLVANNVRLGQINVPIDPRRAPHENLVTVRFTYDVDGLLQVEATVEATGRKLELVVEQNPGLLSPEDIRTSPRCTGEVADPSAQPAGEHRDPRARRTFVRRVRHLARADPRDDRRVPRTARAAGRGGDRRCAQAAWAGSRRDRRRDRLMDALSRFGLSPDASERDLKRAYARRLKETRPDEDPAAFQELHERYQEALAQCRFHLFMADDEATSATTIAPEPQDPIEPRADADIVASPSADFEFDWDRFHADLFEHVRTDEPRALRAWLDAQPALWSLETKVELGARVMAALEDDTPPMTAASFDAVADFFHLAGVDSAVDAWELERLRSRLDLTWRLLPGNDEALRIFSRNIYNDPDPTKAKATHGAIAAC